METTELLKKVRQIEIKTRGLSNNIFAGQYHSAFKGRGMAFSEVREYQFGDDIRDIDWNVTARFNKPYVKVFEGDVYTVTIKAKNGADNTWSYDSFLLYVYDADALKIWVDGEDKDSVLLSNVERIADMDQAEILALKRDIPLKSMVSVNYGEYAWSELADQIVWKSSDSAIASVN